jgi:ribonucleoside-diphosphate reductase alpha chain
MTPTHEKLPKECDGLTHRAMVGDVKFYIETGEYPDGRIGRVKITISKPGNEMRLFDAIGEGMSIGLQHGVPLLRYIRKYKYQELGTGGATDDAEFPHVKSILDYMVRWLESKYTTPQERAQW